MVLADTIGILASSLAMEAERRLSVFTSVARGPILGACEKFRSVSAMN